MAPGFPTSDGSLHLIQLALQYEEAGLWMRSSGDARGSVLLERAEALHQARLVDRDNVQVKNVEIVQAHKVTLIFISECTD